MGENSNTGVLHRDPSTGHSGVYGDLENAQGEKTSLQVIATPAMPGRP